MSKKIGTSILAGAVVVALALLPVLTQAKSTLNLFFLLFLYVVLAQSWNLLGGFAGQVNLGHAAFFGLGALLARTLLFKGMAIWIAMPAAGLLAGALSLLIGAPAFRMRGVYFAIGTLAFAELLRIPATNNFSEVSALPIDQVINYSLVPRYYLGLGIAVLTNLFLVWLTRSKSGLAMMAVREDESAALSSGVWALGTKLMALFCSAFLAGIAGGLFAYYHVSYYHYLAFSPIWTFESLLIVFVGGVGTIIGPILGTIFYVVAREALATRLPEAHLYVFGTLFILVVMIWPGGLIEAGQSLKRVLSGGKKAAQKEPPGQAVKPTEEVRRAGAGAP